LKIGLGQFSPLASAEKYAPHVVCWRCQHTTILLADCRGVRKKKFCVRAFFDQPKKITRHIPHNSPQTAKLTSSIPRPFGTATWFSLPFHIFYELSMCCISGRSGKCFVFLTFLFFIGYGSRETFLHATVMSAVPPALPVPPPPNSGASLQWGKRCMRLWILWSLDST
jgi:hypothetical protein